MLFNMYDIDVLRIMYKIDQHYFNISDKTTYCLLLFISISLIDMHKNVVPVILNYIDCKYFITTINISKRQCPQNPFKYLG